MPKKRSTEEIVYDFICKNPGNSTYSISKNLKMSGGRVRHALLRLKQRSLIKFKFDRHNPRIRKLCFPVDALSLLPRSMKKQLIKIKK